MALVGMLGNIGYVRKNGYGGKERKVVKEVLEKNVGNIRKAGSYCRLGV